MNEAIKIIFGDFTLTEVLGYIWFFIVGYIIYGLTETTGRNIKSKHTPIKWKWKFWFHDNWRRYIVTVLCTYILFRFYEQFSGHDFENFDAVTLGLLGDGISATIKKRVISTQKNRERIKQKYNFDRNEEEIG